MSPANNANTPVGVGRRTARGGVLDLLRRNTIVVLILLLIAFIVGIAVARPGTVNATWLSNMFLFAAPLGILAAGQTLVMLTGGIDLSVAAIATGSAYILATNASLGSVVAVLLGLALGLRTSALCGG
jgi:ribose transport system permease protein